MVATVGEESYSDVYETIAIEFFQYGFNVTRGEKFYVSCSKYREEKNIAPYPIPYKQLFLSDAKLFFQKSK